MLTRHDTRIPVATGTVVDGDLVVPDHARGLVVFAHGSGSSRLSPRNQAVADQLHHRGLATLLFDLLTPDEEEFDQRTGDLRFDVELLADRLAAATTWARDDAGTTGLPVGYFGASTGAAGALIAASDDPRGVSAVVSRGGRPDLAGDRLRRVHCPTLLIVGGADTQVLDLNRRALLELGGEAALEVVPGATHLFPEPGALDRVAELAAQWFATYLTRPTGS